MVPVFDEAFRAEVRLVADLLKHPAGFDLGVFALLEVRPTDQAVYEVAWDRKDVRDRLANQYWRIAAQDGCWRLYKSALRAAVVFCHMRRALELGVDHDIRAMQAVTES